MLLCAIFLLLLGRRFWAGEPLTELQGAWLSLEPPRVNEYYCY